MDNYCTFWNTGFNDCINAYCYYETNPDKTCPKKRGKVNDSAPNNTALLRSRVGQRVVENEKAKAGYAVAPSNGDFKTYGR
jgi:hypothetical protein